MLCRKYNDPLTTQAQRNIILDTIRDLNPADSIPFHLSVFAVDNFDLVHQSSLALDRIGSKRATRSLLKILRHSPWWLSRMFAAATRMQLRDKRAIFPLIDVLENLAEDERVRDQAAEALSVFVHKRPDHIIPALLRAADDASAWVRWSVAFALGNAEDARVIPALERLSKDETFLPGQQVCIGTEAAKPLDDVNDSLQRRKTPRVYGCA